LEGVGELNTGTVITDGIKTDGTGFLIIFNFLIMSKLVENEIKRIQKAMKLIGDNFVVAVAVVFSLLIIYLSVYVF